MSVVETLSAEDFAASGAGQTAQKGEWLGALGDFAGTGNRFGIIRLVDDEGNPIQGARFAGRSASTIATALRAAADSKDAPEEVSKIKVMSKKGNVYLLNEAVEA